MARRFAKPVYTFIYEVGGAWVPKILKKPNTITVEGSFEKVWAARFLRNEHLVTVDEDGVPRQLTYDALDDKPRVIISAWWMTVVPRMALVAVIAVLVALQPWLLAVVAPVTIATYSALMYRRRPRPDPDGNIVGRLAYWFQYAWELLWLVVFSLVSAYLLAATTLFMVPLALCVELVVYLFWVFSVAAIQQSRVTRYWRVYARQLDYAEANDINGVVVRWPTPAFLFRRLNIKTIIIYRNSGPPLKLKWIPNGETVHDLVVGVHLSIPRADLNAGNQQEIGNEINAASAMAGRPLTLDEVAKITRNRAQARRLHSIIFEDSVESDETPTEPIPVTVDTMPRKAASTDGSSSKTLFSSSADEPTRPSEGPPTPPEEPRVFVAGTDDAPLGTITATPKAPPTGWRLWWHRHVHGTPPMRPNPKTGKMESYCPQCDAVFPDK
jgi:hypothetical protein